MEYEANSLIMLIFIYGISLYLIGSIPFAYIIPKIFGFGDIRNIGSGNIGATNVLRLGNKFLAISVLLLDFLKGFIPLIILKLYFSNSIFDFSLLCMLSLLTILGHIFPIWLRFKGGKGVATYIGYLFAFNYFFGLIFIISWIIIASLTKYSSLASIISITIIPIFIFFLQEDIKIFFILFSIGLIIIYKHYPNILRLLDKTENKIKL